MATETWVLFSVHTARIIVAKSCSRATGGWPSIVLVVAGIHVHVGLILWWYSLAAIATDRVCGALVQFNFHQHTREGTNIKIDPPPIHIRLSLNYHVLLRGA